MTLSMFLLVLALVLFLLAGGVPWVTGESRWHPGLIALGLAAFIGSLLVGGR